MAGLSAIVIILIITFGSCKKDQISDIQGLIEQDKWEKVYANSILTLTGIAFANDTTCYSVGAIGCMLKTNNNGDTWTIIDSIETTSPSFTDISFFNSSIGIAVGNAGRISRTTDGGISWLTIFYLVEIQFIIFVSLMTKCALSRREVEYLNLPIPG
jgi:hypothetical protein